MASSPAPSAQHFSHLAFQPEEQAQQPYRYLPSHIPPQAQGYPSSYTPRSFPSSQLASFERTQLRSSILQQGEDKRQQSPTPSDISEHNPGALVRYGHFYASRQSHHTEAYSEAQSPSLGDVPQRTFEIDSHVQVDLLYDQPSSHFDFPSGIIMTDNQYQYPDKMQPVHNRPQEDHPDRVGDSQEEAADRHQQRETQVEFGGQFSYEGMLEDNSFLQYTGDYANDADPGYGPTPVKPTDQHGYHQRQGGEGVGKGRQWEEGHGRLYGHQAQPIDEGGMLADVFDDNFDPQQTSHDTQRPEYERGMSWSSIHEEHQYRGDSASESHSTRGDPQYQQHAHTQVPQHEDNELDQSDEDGKDPQPTQATEHHVYVDNVQTPLRTHPRDTSGINGSAKARGQFKAPTPKHSFSSTAAVSDAMPSDPNTPHHPNHPTAHGDQVQGSPARGQVYPPNKPGRKADAKGGHPHQQVFYEGEGQEEVHISRESVGGRSRLVKRAWSKRSYAEEEEGEMGYMEEEEAPEEEEEFDPMAEIIKFDSQKELVEDWDKIQKQVPEFVMKFQEDMMGLSFDMILMVNAIFYNVNFGMQGTLEEGVKRIEDEEKKQDAARRIIVDFSNEMKRVAQVLSTFGQDSARGLLAATRAGSVTPAGEMGGEGGRNAV